MLAKLNLKPDENLLVGADTADDAAVYRLNGELALISTLDFFPPMVDDPFAFGQVAAANALSDIYAMGGRPVLALNIVAFPRKLPLSVLEEMLRGGADKVTEAGAYLAGGHSIADDSPKYGLAVNGLVHPRRIWTNAGARPGDVLVLTKPLGSGIICTAIKRGVATKQAEADIIKTMTLLNRQAAEAAGGLDVHSCTDITGFGLAGHLAEMAAASGVAMEIQTAAVPLVEPVLKYADMGLIPGGGKRNRDHNQEKVKFACDISPALQDVLFDPQTSGGLLFSLGEKDAARLTQAQGIVIGQVVTNKAKNGILVHFT